jgi:uncharacterized protein YkwD
MMMKQSSFLFLASMLFLYFATDGILAEKLKMEEQTSLTDVSSYRLSMDPSVCQSESESLLEITVITDEFPEDTSWILTRADDDKLVDLSNRFYEPNKEYTKPVCVEEDVTYYFAIMDGHGDGICCEHGQGSYQVKLNGQTVLFQGGAFGNLKEHTFTFGTSGGGGSGSAPRPTPNPTPPPVPPVSTTARPRIQHPHCIPNSGAYNPSNDQISGCSGMLAHCARDRSVHKWEYDQAATMLDRCFRSCANRVGLDNFCSVTPLPYPIGQPQMPYCESEGQTSAWTSTMIQAENQFVTLLNQQRLLGYSCPGNNYYPPVPAVQRNPQLDCAARAQARKIVEYSIAPGFNDASPTLHQVCDYSKNNCDTFQQRMEKAGYTEWWGYIGENTNWGYSTAASTLEGWSQSSGHCPLLMKQDWAHIQVEIGVGFYHDPDTGTVAWVMVAGQQ